MSLLALASDFLERMSNPAYGPEVNQEYALRLARLLEQTEPELAPQIDEAIGQLSDVEVLTPHAWLWLVGWARSRSIRLPSPLSLDLFERWSSPSLRALVLDASIESGDRLQSAPDSIGVFPDEWLRTLLTRSVRPSPPPEDGQAPDVERVAAILFGLLESDVEIALDAAAALLREPWAGRAELDRRLEDYLEELDGEAREALWARLRPGAGPPPPRGRVG